MGAMGTKLRRTKTGITHWCPACEEVHHFKTVGSPAWGFNENFESPSFTPSMLIRWGSYAGHAVPGQAYVDSGICHYFLTDGELRYCGDSTHALASKTVPLPDWPLTLVGSYSGIEED